MSLAAVIFDFDGVLADSEPLHLAGFRAALATKGLTLATDDYYTHFLGYNDHDAILAMADRYGWSLATSDVGDLTSAKARHMPGLLASPEVLYPGAAAFVRTLAHHLPLGIASGALRDEIELVLRANDLAEHFRCIVASGDTPRSKPAPDPYARALALLQELGAVDRDNGIAARCVAIEDSKWGVLSAKGAGMRCVGVTTSYAADELSDADLVVDTLQELTPERLARLAEGHA
jgi:beta-phosphoglucomutase